MVDYTEELEHTLITQGESKNFLSIQKLENPQQRLDGKRVSYMLDYRWLSVECEHEKDEAYVCVQGDERQLYSLKELVDCKVLTTSGKVRKDVNLFDCFTLF